MYIEIMNSNLLKLLREKKSHIVSIFVVIGRAKDKTKQSLLTNKKWQIKNRTINKYGLDSTFD